MTIGLVAQPVLDQPESVRLRVISTGKLEPVRDASVRFLEPCPGARVHPEHPGLRRRLSDIVAVLDSELRLAVASSTL